MLRGFIFILIYLKNRNNKVSYVFIRKANKEKDNKLRKLL